MKFIKTARFVIACGIILLAMPVHAEPSDTGPLRVGVIVLQPDDESSLAAEAITVTLLPDLDAQPVERAELDRVLTEQALSLAAMSDPASALRMGKALRADALLILEPNEHFLHARMMDTLHGMILTEALLDVEHPESFGPTLKPALARALEKVRVPAAELVYVSVMGVTAAADVEQLKTLASQLGPLIRADLQAVPNVRVVERAQLAQIAREIRLAGGEAAIIGSAVTIEGELRPVTDGSQAGLTVIITDLAAQDPISATAEPTALDIAALREAARHLIVQHLKQVQAEAPVQAGPAEAAAILARTLWRVEHDDFEGAEGVVESALMIDNSPQRLTEAWRVYYELGISSGDGTPTLTSSRAIQAIRRRHELLLQRLRHPSHTKELAGLSSFYPMHFETVVLMQAVSDEDRAIIADITRTADELYALAEAQAHVNGNLRRLLFVRGRDLLYVVDDPQDYIRRMKALIGQIRTEMAKEDSWENDPMIGLFLDHFWGFDEYESGPDETYVRFGSKEVRPLFDWMLEQGDRGLWVVAYWYRLKYGPAADRTEAAHMLLSLTYEGVGPDRPVWGCSGFWPEHCYGLVLEDAIQHLRAKDEVGIWIDQFLDRIEATDSLDPILRIQPRDMIRMIEIYAGDGEALRTERIDRLMALLEGVEYDDSDKDQHVSAIRSFGRVLQEQIEIDKAAHNNPWNDYNKQLIEINWLTEELQNPYEYMLTGQRGDEDRQIYVAWLGEKRGDRILTRSSLRGGELKVIGRADGYTRPMAVCRGRLIAGGEKGVWIFSEEDGSVARFGTEQGLPDSRVFSMGVVGDRVIVGCLNGLAILDPVSGELNVIANALAVDANSPLDRVPPYAIEEILMLNGYNRFWFVLGGNNAGQLCGLWQHDLDTGETRKVEGTSFRTNAWKHRGQIIAWHDNKRGFFRIDPDANRLVPHDQPAYRKEWNGHYTMRPVIVGDHMFLADATRGYIYDALGREFPGLAPAAWKYAVELSDESVFIGYSFFDTNTGMPAMWILTHKNASR